MEGYTEELIDMTFPQAPSPTMTSFLRISDMTVVQKKDDRKTETCRGRGGGGGDGG